MDPLLRVNIERDLNEISKLIKSYMTKTYIKDLTQEVFRCDQQCKGNMSREGQLIEALLPFVPDEKRGMLNEMNRLLRYEQVANIMLPRLIGKGHGEGMRQESDQFIKETVVKVLLFKIMSTIENR